MTEEAKGLLACPFCGEGQLLEEHTNAVCCQRCGGSSYVETEGFPPGMGNAVERWNTRARPTEGGAEGMRERVMAYTRLTDRERNAIVAALEFVLAGDIAETFAPDPDDPEELGFDSTDLETASEKIKTQLRREKRLKP